METMKSSKQMFKLGKVAIPMALFAFLAVQCSSDNSTGEMDATMDDQELNSGQDANASGMNEAMNNDGVSTMENTGTDMGTDGASGTVVVTPAQERMDATTEMNGLRATLMADLEVVRSRLKAGGQEPEMKKADQARAADLAQGLERVDRTLVAMGEATDATWATMRDTQLKEVADVREWMAKYKKNEMTGAM